MRDVGAMFTYSYRNYSQSKLRVSSSFTNSNPPWICPLFARQQRLGPCFGWDFMGPISQDTRHGTATRTLSQAKCKTMQNRVQRAIHHGSEGLRSQDKQYSTVDYFKVQIYLYICARCPTRVFGTGRVRVTRAERIQVGHSNWWSITLKSSMASLYNSSNDLAVLSQWSAYLEQAISPPDTIGAERCT